MSLLKYLAGHKINYNIELDNSKASVHSRHQASSLFTEHIGHVLGNGAGTFQKLAEISHPYPYPYSQIFARISMHISISVSHGVAFDDLE